MATSLLRLAAKQGVEYAASRQNEWLGLVDTPGLRSFGIIDIAKEEISHFFPELFNVSEHCRLTQYHFLHPHPVKIGREYVRPSFYLAKGTILYGKDNC